MTKYSIYTLNLANRAWAKIGSGLTENNTISIEPQITDSLLELVKQLVIKVNQFEKNYELTENDKKKFVVGSKSDESDVIDFTFIDKIAWRSGSIYVGIQYSHKTQKVRIIMLGTNKIHHQGVCFNTNPINLPTSEIVNKLNEINWSQVIEKEEINDYAKKKLMCGDYNVGI